MPGAGVDRHSCRSRDQRIGERIVLWIHCLNVVVVLMPDNRLDVRLARDRRRWFKCPRNTRSYVNGRASGLKKERSSDACRLPGRNRCLSDLRGEIDIRNAVGRGAVGATQADERIADVRHADQQGSVDGVLPDVPHRRLGKQNVALLIERRAAIVDLETGGHVGQLREVDTARNWSARRSPRRMPLQRALRTRAIGLGPP